MSMEATLIAPDQLAALQATEPVVIIDTRDADTYAAGHIPGAVNLREVFTFLATSTPEGLKELKATFADALGKAGLSGAETAVFYEDAMNSGYGQSCRGYYLLTWLGYPKIKVLNGGFSAWKAAGLPVSTTVVTPVPASFPDLPMADAMLTQADVQAAPDDTVYLYCFKGARASNTFLALKQAGFTDVRMYFGSWNEWSRDPSLPIETGLPLAAPANKPQLAMAA